MSMPLWRTKSITEHSGQHSGLKRVFGPWRLIAMGVGVTVGAGLFSLTGVVAGQNAGPAVTLSFLIAALAASFAGLCYAELSGMIPAGGSAYSYAYTGLGEGAAWIIGWDLILEYTVGAAAVASSWSGYLASLLKGWGITLDPRLLAIPGTPVTMPNGSTAHAWFNAPSIFIICAITALLMRGTSESVRFNTLVVIFKVIVIGSMIVACIPFIHLSNYHPFIPPNTGEYGHFGFSGVMRAAGMAFFAYIGIDIVSTAAQDTKNPQRNMPIGILGSLAACAFIYIVFSTMLIGIVDYHKLANDPSPVATAIDQVHMPWLAVLVKIGVTLGYISGLFGLLIGQSRIAHNMAHDGLIPSKFSRLNKRTQTPWTAHILTAIASSILAACMPIGALGAMTAIGTLLAFIIVCTAVPALRLRAPQVSRRFKVPGGPFLVPALGILSCGIVMVSIDLMTWIRLLVWLVIGMVIYVTYGMRHSRLNTPSRHDPS